MLWVPVVQAVTIAMLGTPESVPDRQVARIMLITLAGTKKGDTLSWAAIQEYVGGYARWC